jgi:hypothetical protein
MAVMGLMSHLMFGESPFVGSGTYLSWLGAVSVCVHKSGLSDTLRVAGDRVCVGGSTVIRGLEECGTGPACQIMRRVTGVVRNGINCRCIALYQPSKPRAAVGVRGHKVALRGSINDAEG